MNPKKMISAATRPHISGFGAGRHARFANAGLEPVIARLEMDAMTILFLFEQREQHTQHRRQIFLDTGRNKFSNVRLRLNLLQPLIKRREHHCDCRVRRAQGLRELICAIKRIEREDDRPGFPRADLGDQKLRAIGEHQRDSVAATDAETRQRAAKPIAGSIQLGIRQPPALEQHRRRVGRERRVLAQVVDEALFRIRRKRGGNVAIVMSKPRLHSRQG